MKLPDRGAKKVAALWRELGVGDVDALEAACHDQRVRSIRGFGPRMEEKILAGIALYRRSGARRRLGDVLPTAEELQTCVPALPAVIPPTTAGHLPPLCD